MFRKRIITSVILVLVAALLNIAIINYVVPEKEYNLMVDVTLNFDKENGVQLYYMTGDRTPEEGFLPNEVEKADYEKANREQTLSYTVPGDVGYLRLDIGEGESTGCISDITISSGKTSKKIDLEKEGQVLLENQASAISGEYGLNVVTSGEDPHLVWNAENWGVSSVVKEGNNVVVLTIKIILLAILDVLILFIIVFWKKASIIPKELWHDRKLILRLAKNDFKTKFAGSYLGVVWAFVQPIVTVLVYWFVFEKGLKAGGVNTAAGIQVPFALWLVAGLVPWFFFQDALNGGTNALVEYSYLVKKVVFKISILPIVKVISSLFVHVFFIIFTLVLYAGYHYYPDLYTLQIVYYSFGVFMLSLGLAYLTSALMVFFRDLSQIINIILQVGVWMTPIMWNIDTMELPPILIKIFKLNPMYYIVAGYRDSLINKVWFWENPRLTLYYWIFTIAILGIGLSVFRRLKVHFADVL